MITSVANRTVKAVRRLGKRPWRERQGSLLCEGHRALRAAVESGATIHQVLVIGSARERRADLLDQAKQRGAEVVAISPGIMRYLTGMASPPDILSVVKRREATLAEQRCDPAVVLLSEVRDPATAGGIMATAVAAGCNGAIQALGSVDPFERKAIRAGGGAQLRLDVVRSVTEQEAIEHHRADGAKVVSLAAGGGPIWNAVLPDRALFVIDGEGAAGDRAVEALADDRVGAPPGVSVASAATMLLYEWMRQRGT